MLIYEMRYWIITRKYRIPASIPGFRKTHKSGSLPENPAKLAGRFVG